MAKKKNQCENCRKLTEVPGKDYGLCERAKNSNPSKNPYRRLEDSCPGFEEK